MRMLPSTLLVALAFAGQAGAQTGSSYWGYSVSGSSPETINAYLTVQGGDMGTCNHTFTDSLVLTGPGGRGETWDPYGLDPIAEARETRERGL